MSAFGYKRTSGALVNHSLGGDVTEGYNQLATSDLAEAMQIVTDRMKELCKVQPIGGEGEHSQKTKGLGE